MHVLDALLEKSFDLLFVNLYMLMVLRHALQDLLSKKWTHRTHTLLRYVDHVPILVISFFRHSIQLGLVSLDRDGPELDIEVIELLEGYWTRWDIIVRESLIARNVVKVVCAHFK